MGKKKLTNKTQISFLLDTGLFSSNPNNITIFWGLGVFVLYYFPPFFIRRRWPRCFIFNKQEKQFFQSIYEKGQFHTFVRRLEGDPVKNVKYFRMSYTKLQKLTINIFQILGNQEIIYYLLRNDRDSRELIG